MGLIRLHMLKLFYYENWQNDYQMYFNTLSCSEYAIYIWAFYNFIDDQVSE